ncbi:MAG: PAS domain S-box protein [Mojavia pulchra JT2-VF2]|jgi:PAS domain S-box-containing protein|uniref:histidine kinase n=1 Tax=Mojavia pulchra JT2-VF2 TaxID=287848 RepID=A0A951PXZ2_9NOST|nr:PAS domain S-box protein [Mojavia pulchra JT2-VF2]
MDKFNPSKAAVGEKAPLDRAILYPSCEFMGLMELDGTLIDINQMALDFGGLTNVQVIGRPLWEAGWWRISQATQAQLQQAIAQATTGELVCSQVDILGVGNTTATLDFAIRPIKNTSGKIILLTFKGREITEGKITSDITNYLNVQEQFSVQLTAQLAATKQQIAKLSGRERAGLAQQEAANAYMQLDADIVNSMPLGLIVWYLEDPNDINSMRLITANPAASHLTGVTLSNYIGKYITECYPSKIIKNQVDIELYAKVALSGLGQEQQVYYCEQNTPCSFFNVRIFPLPNCCVGVAFDNITQPQVAGQALQESEQRWANLAKISPVGIFRTDLSGNYLYVNEQWCNITKIPLADALGKSWQTAIHPDDLKRIDSEAQDMVTDKKPFTGEFRFLHPDGEITWVFSRTVAETGDNGEVISYVGTITDITELKQAEQALRESEERFHTMADTAPVMIWMSGLDKLCNFFNQSWLDFTGRTMEQELGNGWTEGVHPEDLEHCLNTYLTAFENRQNFSMEYRLRRFDGEYRWVWDTGTPLFTTDGSFAGYIGSCIDISEQQAALHERKQAELALQQRAEELTRLNNILAQTTTILQKRNQELEQFAYVASHDLKAPLRAITSLSEWLEEDLADQLPEENQHQMRLLRGRVRRMEALINGLLEYSRIGRIDTELSLVNVGMLLNEVIESLQPPSTFRIEIAPGMPTILTKRVPLQQVFANLIGNAIEHHSRVDGIVKISVQDQGNSYEFSIADDGPGIPSEYHNKIFVIFQTLESRDRKENTGIGLAIVKKIIETEGGTITLESILGQGSTFRFTWPKQTDE